MSLDLTKAPWPWLLDQVGHKRIQDRSLVLLTFEEYAFARHRVNLFEELVRELDKRTGGGTCDCPECRALRRLLEEARK